MEMLNYRNWVSPRIDLKDKDRLSKLFAMGMVEETGEIAGKLKRIYRGDDPVPSFKDLLTETMDTYWYITAYAALEKLEMPDTQVAPDRKDYLSISKNTVALSDEISSVATVILSDETPDLAKSVDLLAALVGSLGFTMDEGRNANYVKLVDRYARNQTKGSGDKR